MQIMVLLQIVSSETHCHEKSKSPVNDLTNIQTHLEWPGHAAGG